MDERLRRGIAFDLTRGRPIRADDLPTPEEIEGLTLYVNRRTDLSGLPTLPRLQALSISGTPGVLPPSKFPALEHYQGPVFPGALESKALRWFSSGEATTSLSPDHAFAGAVETLLVDGGRSEGGLPQLRHPKALRELSLWRFSTFDLDGLHCCSRLERVELVGVDKLRSADSLGPLPGLEYVSLERVLNIEPMSAVHDWRARQKIAIIHKHPFDSELRDRLARSDAPWSFPTAPAFYVPPVEAPSDR